MEKFFYRVKQNETVSILSKKFNCPQTILIKENNLKCELSEGDIVLIERHEDLYMIEPKDNLQNISEKLNENSEYLLEKNKTPYFFYGEMITK
ncbi:MAG: LysM peptidoglycan-binding domain-containing protein [Clostridia bacterium]|nr:LysM peptidoglycan-binding domain-containing protein [Clostridia bacterium]